MRNSVRNSRKLLIIGFVVFLAVTAGTDEIVRAEDDVQFYENLVANRITSLRNTAVVMWGSVAAPIGRFLLIRKGSDMCAVSFEGMHRAGDAKLPTMFHSGDEHRYAEYDWYYQNDGSGDFTRKNTEHGHDTLASGPLIGIGRLAFQTGNIVMSCGPFKLHWGYPDLVDIFPGIRPGDYGIEMAPTSWSNIADVKGNDPDLKWFRYDENRENMTIPISDLKK